MHILAELAVAGVPIVIEQGFQLVDMVRRQGKMIAFTELSLRREAGHLLTVVAVEAVTTDHGGPQPFAGKQAAEYLTRSGGSSAGGAGNRDDRMAFRHKQEVRKVSPGWSAAAAFRW